MHPTTEPSSAPILIGFASKTPGVDGAMCPAITSIMDQIYQILASTLENERRAVAGILLTFLLCTRSMVDLWSR